MCKKRICLFVGSMNRGGGTERMTQLLANTMAEENFEVFVLSKCDLKNCSYFPLDSNVHYDILDNETYYGTITVIKDILWLSKYVRKNKIDVLINVDVALGIFSLPLKILNPKTKLIFWEHFSVLFGASNQRMEQLRKLALKIGDCYVTLTLEDADEVKKRYKCKCPVVSIPNICAVNETNDKYDEDSKQLISAGHFLHVKGFDLAIDVAQKVFEKHPDWNWTIFGDGQEYENLNALVKEKGLKENIAFPGRVKDLFEEYKKSAVFVLTSRSEGFGLVIAEAQACHLPTVAFDVPYGPRTLIKENENGFLIEPFDTQKMADKICELIENKYLRVSFSKKASKELEKYSAQSVLKQWEILLGDL